MEYIVEKIITDEETDKSILFCKNTNELFQTRLPMYPEGTTLTIGADDLFHVVPKDNNDETLDIITSVSLFYAEAPFISLEKMNALLHIALKTKVRLYPIWISRPYDLLSFKRLDESDILSIHDICRAFYPTTFEEHAYEVLVVTQYILMQLKGYTGSVYFSFTKVYQDVNSLFAMYKKAISMEAFSAFMHYFSDTFYLNSDVITADTILALQEDYNQELKIYNWVKTRLHQKTPFPMYRAEDISDLAKEQNEAIKELILQDGCVSILTGGPGTGKTTILHHIVSNMQMAYPDVKIAMLAPTGKAAKRMKEVMYDLEVKNATIHKFLGYRKDVSYVLPDVIKNIKSTQLIIIDEASMLGTALFADLLNALDLDQTKIILVGDIDQLPSVDAGALLRDLTEIGIPLFSLFKNYRSKEAKSIIENSKKINASQEDLVFDEQFVITQDDIYDRLDEIINEDAIILSPYITPAKKWSTYHINTFMHKKNSFAQFHIKFHPMEHVIVTKTKYRSGNPIYVNGETGVVKSACINEDGTYHYTIDTGEEDIVVPEADLDYAYALTIHKSQGSEYNTVYLVIPEFSLFITKKMLYTAVSRAKQKVVIYTTPAILQRIIHNDTDAARNTFLHLLQLQND